uniref:RNase H type-1 domain-containing protein n=1 Tax=Schizaphis graminum TaxID=13262 RepID=A0A2S2P5Q9_SCHGA
MPNNSFNILTDSLSTLASIQNSKRNNEITNNIINLLNSTTKHITLTWIPSHTGIEGNEKADMMAKQATSDQTIEMLNFLSKDDLKREAKNITINLWRKEWHLLRDNKLREIKSTTDRWINPTNLTREQEVILTRLRIGHSWHTHKHLMDKTDPEPCITCGSEISIKHLLLECRQFNDERSKYNMPSTISECLNNEPLNIYNTLSFIHRVI